MTDTKTKRVVITVSCVSSFVTPFMASAINVALPAIQADFHVNAILLAWVATSYLLSTAVFVLPFGKVADIRGRKKVYVWGLVIFTLSSFLSAVSGSIYQLLAARVVQGIGIAMIFSTGMAIVTAAFPVRERGMAIGITVAAVYIGLSAGPFVGGLLTQYISWRSVFGVVVPMGALTIYLATEYLEEERGETRGERLDVVGSVLYGISIMLTMYGFSTLPSVQSFWAILAGVALFCVFAQWEFKVTSPVFNVELFTVNRAFAFSGLAALVNYSATFAVTFLLSLYLQYIKGLDPRSAGLVLVTQPIMMAVFSPFAGRLSDRIEPRKVASLGMALTAVGLFAMAVLTSLAHTSFIVLDLVLLGIGFALFSSPNMNAIMSSVYKRFYGIAAGAAASMRLLGQMFSMGIATVMLSVYVGPVKITPEQYPAFLRCVSAAFLVFGFLCVLGIFASLARGPLRQE